MEDAKLSCYILTKNSERRLNQVLLSVVGVVDDLVVLDSGSSDRTIEIAKSFGARILHREFDNFSNQRNYGLSQCVHDWVFELDSDEVVSEPLQQKILALKKSGFEVEGGVPDAFGILREWFVLERKVNCFYPIRCPDQPLRIYQRKKVSYKTDRLVHESPVGHQTSWRVDEPLLHYSCDTVDQMYSKINQYTTLAAREMFQSRKKSGWFKIVAYPWLVWFKYYVVLGGWKDGPIGLIHGRYVRDNVWQYLVKLKFDFGREARSVDWFLRV